jgi:hypothetical protein
MVNRRLLPASIGRAYSTYTPEPVQGGESGNIRERGRIDSFQVVALNLERLKNVAVELGIWMDRDKQEMVSQPVGRSIAV